MKQHLSRVVCLQWLLVSVCLTQSAQPKTPSSIPELLNDEQVDEDQIKQIFKPMTLRDAFNHPKVFGRRDSLLLEKDSRAKQEGYSYFQQQPVNHLNMLSPSSLAGLGSTEECLADLAAVEAASKNGSVEARKMLDSWARPGSGLFDPGSFQQGPMYLGEYDQCMEVDVDVGLDWDTKYCKAVILAQTVPPFNLNPGTVKFTIGVCLPRSCNTSDVQNVVTATLPRFLPSFVGLVVYAECQEERHPELSGKAQAVIAICSIFALLLLLGTLYDVLVVRELWRCVVPEEKPTVDLSALLEDSQICTSCDTHQRKDEYEPLITKSTKIQPEVEDDPGLTRRLLLPFSIVANTERIFNTHAPPGTISCINGIRFLSMSWVILGHSYIMAIQSMDHVNEYLTDSYSNWTFQGIMSALVSVDTFFTLSGLLMTYLVMKQLSKAGGASAGFFLKFYVHRLWRLTPPYMLVLMTYVTLFKYIGDGPIWPQSGIEQDECEGSWWTNLLYINNLAKTDEMCMGWTWYLANDMQFFVISPLFFMPMFYYGYKGIAAPVAMIVVSFITSGVISSEYNMDPNMDILSGFGNDYFDLYYIKPYNRIGAYLVGMVTGYLLYRSDCKARMNKMHATLGWAAATAVGLAVVYGLAEHTKGERVTDDVAALYNALHRTAWSMAVSWVIYACANGYGGIINQLLSWTALIPLSRLTYMAYLLHPPIIYFFYFTQRRLFYLNNTNITFSFLATLVMAYMVAYVATLAYEWPFLGLEKVIFGGMGSRPKPKRDFKATVPGLTASYRAGVQPVKYSHLKSQENDYFPPGSTTYGSGGPPNQSGSGTLAHPTDSAGLDHQSQHEQPPTKNMLGQNASLFSGQSGIHSASTSGQFEGKLEMNSGSHSGQFAPSTSGQHARQFGESLNKQTTFGPPSAFPDYDSIRV